MKQSIKNILAGVLAVAVMAFGLTFTIPAGLVSAEGPIDDGMNAALSEGQQTSLFGDNGVFTNIISVALFLIGAISVLMLIYGGIRYTLSAGNATHVTAAKNTILYAIVGIIVALLSYAIVRFVLTSLGGETQ